MFADQITEAFCVCSFYFLSLLVLYTKALTQTITTIITTIMTKTAYDRNIATQLIYILFTEFFN